MMDDIDHFHHLQQSTIAVSKRRDFLRNSGNIAALSALPIAIPANANRATTIYANTLFRWEDQHSSEFAKLLSDSGINGYELENDLVRQWRDGLREILISEKNNSIIGLTNWSDYFMLRELAAEERKFPLVEVQLSDNQYQHTNVLARYAQQLVAVAQNTGDQTLQKQVNQLSSRSTQSKSLFAWVIA